MPEQTPARLGYHYFPDTLHYRDHDLQTWLPELQALGAHWLTVIAPRERSIPEDFLNALMDAGIQPILHLPLPLELASSRDASLGLLFRQYARWGVRYLALYDRPNQRLAWPAAAWAQVDLVERFLDFFLPVAELVLAAGLTPVFPPLEPGGDYSDVAFLRSALRGVRRRASAGLQRNLALGAYAWAGNRPLAWGAGGPERWPASRPYQAPPGVEDQLGFRIFDWYLAIAEAELGRAPDILLLRAGCRPGDRNDPSRPAVDVLAHSRRTLSLARLLADGPEVEGDHLPQIPAAVKACNFWLLTTSSGSLASRQAWFQPDGTRLPVVAAIQYWYATLGMNLALQ